MNYKDIMKKKNNFAIILAAATVSIGLLVVFFGIYPLYKSASAVTKEVNQKSDELKGLKNRKAILDGLKDREDELNKSAELVASALPDSRDVGGLFIQVNALAAKTGGKVSSMSGSSSPSGATATDTGFSGIEKYTYGVPITFTSYLSFKEFVASSKNALRLLNIDDVMISANEASGLSVTMNLTTYTRK